MFSLRASKNFFLTLFFHFLILFLQTVPSLAGESLDSLVDKYYAVPPFLQSGNIKPNVLLIVDNSGSMKAPAYWPSNLSFSRTDTSFDPDKSYYGIFDPDAKYSYNKTKNFFYKDENGEWSGNFLNWLTMRRYDILLKVLVGGNYKEKGGDKFLQGFNVCEYYYYYYIFTKRCEKTGYFPSKYRGKTFYIGIDRDGNLRTRNDRYWFVVNGRWYAIRVKIEEEPSGLIQDFSSKLRLGLMVFNHGNEYEDGEKRGDGGHIVSYISDNNTSLEDIFLNQDVYEGHYKPLYPHQWTPLAETYYEAVRYFRAKKSAYNKVNYSNHDPIQFRCQKNFVVLITDGEATKDKNLPRTAFKGKKKPVRDKNFSIKVWMKKIADNEGYRSQWKKSYSSDGTYYLEGVSYYAHVSDLRPDLEGQQNLTLYTIYTFGKSNKAIDLLNKSAKYGGFTDLNGNGKPDLLQEWDKNNDGYADNFFNPTDGEELEEDLSKAFLDILKRASSGTSVGIPSQKKSATSSTISHSVILQAMFYPNRKFEEGGELSWIGYLYSWWLYNSRFAQNIREDTNKNFVLDILEDRILEWALDENGKLTIKAYKSSETGKKDNSTEPEIYESFDETHPIWEAGENLLYTSAEERKIYTHIGKQLIDFKPDNWSQFIVETSYEDNIFKIPLLGLPAHCFNVCEYFNKKIYTPWNMFKAFIDCIQPEDYQNLISYIRGIDFPELRSRRIDGETPPQDGSDENVWKLGDIIYSTPWIEKYDNYTVAFVGANDGMLHAFRVGYLKRRPAPLSPVSVQNDKTDNETDLLGEELWAFIPQNVLPYLALLANKNYKHIYTVDLKPFVVHIKQGGKERKILVGGLRLGGAVGASGENAVHPPFYACPANFWKEMKNWCEECTGLITLPFVGSNFICNLIPQPTQNYSQCYGLSSYFALDVTDPENPKFLWEFTRPDLGFSYSGGTVVKKKDKYYIMFGSGPTNYKGDSNQSLRYFVLDLLTGDLKTTIDRFTSSVQGNGRGSEIRNAFSGRMNEEAIDVDGNGESDYVVVGYARKDGNMQNWKGGLLLFDVRDDNPKNWYGVKYFTDAQSPITAAVKFGKCFNKIYLFFGTGRWFYKTDNSLPGQRNRIYGVPLNCNGNECRPNVNVAHSSHDVCVDIGNHVERSWYLELNNDDPGYLKERVISNPTVTDENVVFFTTIEPTDDPCGFGGRSRIWALNCATGGTIYSACPGGKYAVSPPEGKLYFQLSGANIVVINPKTEFGTNEKNASPYSKWYQGIAPETGTPFVGYSKGLVGKLLFWIER